MTPLSTNITAIAGRPLPPRDILVFGRDYTGESLRSHVRAFEGAQGAPVFLLTVTVTEAGLQSAEILAKRFCLSTQDLLVCGENEHTYRQYCIVTLTSENVTMPSDTPLGKPALCVFDAIAGEETFAKGSMAIHAGVTT